MLTHTLLAEFDGLAFLLNSMDAIFEWKSRCDDPFTLFSLVSLKLLTGWLKRHPNDESAERASCTRPIVCVPHHKPYVNMKSVAGN